ncbi:MAG: 2-C-methyl-D-erythritol 4-phosphate cytidylyltransferase [Acidobacteriota bacterium]|nr:2-C-methyl-D-erythritol 4-phosphate cytidylyltransferase [Acidobacteriota bacterium]
MSGIVVAAGRAERFGASVPKQFLDLGGVSCVERATRALTSCPGVDDAVVVLAPEETRGARGRALADLPGVAAVVAGGATRAASVRRGLAAAAEATHVLVHDAARPLASPRLVERVLRATLDHGAAVPAVEIADTVKELDDAGTVARTLERARLRLAQTPQGLRADWLEQALIDAEGAGATVTDEAAALEKAGRRVVVVPGESSNLKITNPEDLVSARMWLSESASVVRVGTGFDVHRFGGEGPLVLGGVEFPEEPGLAGHSDADVVLHAVMDALLGATSMGDIGEHFPPDDERFRGAKSTRLATEVAGLVRSAGFAIVNVDVTVLAERPRLRPRVEEMKAAVAAALEIEPGQVGIKATTLEGLGALGRGEGIACEAVAAVQRARPRDAG